MERRTVRLENVKFVVLDEADRMLDMGFIDDINYILNQVPKNHQTALFSATMPEEIVRLSHRYLRNPLTIFIDSDELSVDTVDQKIVQVEEDDKFRVLCSFLEKDLISRGIVFCATKIRCDRLAQALHANRYDTMAIHGDLCKMQGDMASQAWSTSRPGGLGDLEGGALR